MCVANAKRLTPAAPAAEDAAAPAAAEGEAPAEGKLGSVSHKV